MGIKFSRVKVKGYSNPIKKAERINDWGFWILFAAGVAMGILGILIASGKI